MSYSYSTSPASTSWTRKYLGVEPIAGPSCISASFCALAGTEGDVFVATSTSAIESATWKRSVIEETHNPLTAIACTSTTSCVVVDESGNVLKVTVAANGTATAVKHDIDGTNELDAITCTTNSTCVAVDRSGNIFVSKNSGETWTKQYALGKELFASEELEHVSCASSTLCVTDAAREVVSFSPAGEAAEGPVVSPSPGTTIDYNVPVSGTGAPHNMSAAEVAKWGQKAEEAPEEATAITPPDSPQGWPASSYSRATLYYLDSIGRVVNTAAPSTGAYGAISTTEYNEFNDVVRTLSPDNRATALEDGCESTEKCKSAEVSGLLDTINTYNEANQYDEPAGCRKETDEPEKEKTEPGTRLCETWGPEHEVKYVPNGYKAQTEKLARNHTKYYYEDAKHYEEAGLGAPPAGEKYDLVTETQQLAQTFNTEGKSEEEVESRRSTTSYSGQGKLGWELRAPTSTMDATESEGAKLEHKTLYIKEGEAKGQIQETRGPKGLSGESAHDSRIIYYTAEENKEGYASCGKHPEWAGLVCETLPGKQPAETTGVPKLPITTSTYNIWDEPEKVEETFEKTATEPAVTRKKIETYDEAGRLKTSGTTSTSTKNTAVPTITDEYNKATGILEKQCANEGKTCSEGKPKTITSVYNTLGQVTEYTDADGNIAKYKYGSLEKDGLLEETSDSSGEGKSGENRSTQKYVYNETTKEMTELKDSAAGVFTASYDTEGKLASEVYPNGLCANYRYNSVGEATHIEYIKTSSCSEKELSVWFSETRVPSARGETMSRQSTLASETYTYDTLGRLTETQETPAGEYCKTRTYAYDEEANRTKLTTHEPNSKKECTTEGGTIQEHTYDEANRLIDSGIEYDPLGNVTKLPAADAEGHELKSTFYADNAVATQEQNSVKNEYLLDPNGRVRETVTGAKKVISHYDGPDEAVAWACEMSPSTKECEAGTFTRNIPGIDGTLSAVQTNGGIPVLQLHDLEGDVVATAADNKTETKLLSTYNSTEFGVPNAGKAPPTFAWLGAADVPSSLSTGIITYGATSYVPQTGRALQSKQVEPPGAPGGTGIGTPYSDQLEPWVMQGAGREASEAPGIGATEEREAVERALEAAIAAREDPIYHYRAWEAKEKGERLLKLVTAGDLTEALGTLFGTLADWVDGFVEAHVTTEVAFDWLEEYGQFLEACVRELHAAKDSRGGCRASYSNFLWEGSNVADFWEKPVISYCLVGKSESGAIDGLGLHECTRLAYEEELSKFGKA